MLHTAFNNSQFHVFFQSTYPKNSKEYILNIINSLTANAFDCMNTSLRNRRIELQDQYSLANKNIESYADEFLPDDFEEIK